MFTKPFDPAYAPTPTGLVSVSLPSLQQPATQDPLLSRLVDVPGLQVGRIPLLSASDVSQLALASQSSCHQSDDYTASER